MHQNFWFFFFLPDRVPSPLLTLPSPSDPAPSSPSLSESSASISIASRDRFGCCEFSRVAGLSSVESSTCFLAASGNAPWGRGCCGVCCCCDCWPMEKVARVGVVASSIVCGGGGGGGGRGWEEEKVGRGVVGDGKDWCCGCEESSLCSGFCALTGRKPETMMM